MVLLGDGALLHGAVELGHDLDRLRGDEGGDLRLKAEALAFHLGQALQERVRGRGGRRGRGRRGRGRGHRGLGWSVDGKE